MNVPRLVTAYFTGRPDPAIASQRVSFGTSGHRGSAFDDAFNEAHILAITQAICLHRAAHGVTGPLFIGIDTHALSIPALASALEVLAANGVETMIDAHDGYTPTPVISHAILTYNRGRSSGLADGIVITPSHNPPEDGGFKYNPPHGGPADTDVTSWIEAHRERVAEEHLDGVRRIPYARAVRSPHVHRYDYIAPYVADLAAIIDMDAIRSLGGALGIDPLGGAARALLAADHRALRHRRDRGQRRGRSDIPVHDGGLGWEDPHGLLLALCHDAADRHARQLRRGVRQRYRRRPAWHRDPLRRADEPELLPGRRDRLSVRGIAPTGAQRAASARRSSAAA